MKATVNIDVNSDLAIAILRIAGFNVEGKTKKELCEMAIRMNDSYGVKTESIVWEDKELKKENNNEQSD